MPRRVATDYDCGGDGDGDVQHAPTRDELLDNISLCWFTDTVASPARIPRACTARIFPLSGRLALRYPLERRMHSRRHCVLRQSRAKCMDGTPREPRLRGFPAQRLRLPPCRDRQGGFAMHASSIPHAWHHWRERAVSDAPAAKRAAAPASVADDSTRERLRAVRWVPIVVPGMALLMLVCASLIGSVLK